MKLNIFTLAVLLIFPAIINASRHSHKDKKKQPESKEKHRKSEVSEEEPEEYVTEEYSGRQVMQVERRGAYLVGFIDVPKKKSAAEKAKVEYLDPRAATYNKREERRKDRKKKKEGDPSNTFFNNDVNSDSEASSVADEYPLARPTVTEDTATYSDFISGRGTKLIAHISNNVGDFDIPSYTDGSDILAVAIKPACLYTYHHFGLDGYMTVSNKVQANHVNRNERIHPMRVYVRENEVDPTVPHYDSYDVETSQKDMETHFGRGVGRDNKPKIFANRNTFSSINAGCAIM